MRRVLGGVLFILFLPVMIVVGLLMLPLMLIARLFGFRPPGGCGRRKGWHRDEGQAEGAGDVGTTTQV